MGRGEPIRWKHRTATLDDGRTIAWTWQPAGRYPQIVTAHVDGELVADRVNADGTITRHADVAAELLRSIGHPDGAAHRPRVWFKRRRSADRAAAAGPLAGDDSVRWALLCVVAEKKFGPDQAENSVRGERGVAKFE